VPGGPTRSTFRSNFLSHAAARQTKKHKQQLATAALASAALAGQAAAQMHVVLQPAEVSD
jgi:hypothetical protein